MTHPGPLAARSIRCKHGLLARHVASNGLSPRLVAVPRAVLKQFAAMYHPRVISQQWRDYRAKISKKKPASNTEMNGSAAHTDGTQSSGAININGTSGGKKKDLSNKSPSGSVSPRKSIKLSRSPGKSASHVLSNKHKDGHVHSNTNDLNGTNTAQEDSSTAALDSIVDWSYLEIKIDSPICNICQVRNTLRGITPITLTDTCHQDAQSIQKRCDAEKAQITLLDRQEIGEHEVWYLINKPWLDDWRAFVLRRKFNLTAFLPNMVTDSNRRNAPRAARSDRQLNFVEIRRRPQARSEARRGLQRRDQRGVGLFRVHLQRRTGHHAQTN